MQNPPVVVAQGLQALTLSETDAARSEHMDTSSAPEYRPLKQYLWKHPGRAGRITLYSGPGGNKVSFSHLADGTPYEECTPHGAWEQQEKLLRICFNHKPTSTKWRSTSLSGMILIWTYGTWLDHMKAGTPKSLPSFSLGLRQQRTNSELVHEGHSNH